MDKRPYFSDDDLRRYRKLPAKEILRWLTEINELAQKMKSLKMTQKTKKKKSDDF